MNSIFFRKGIIPADEGSHGCKSMRASRLREAKMIKRILLTAGIVVAFAGSSFASHCPKDMAAIDAALAKNPKLSAGQMAGVKRDRAEGERLHKEGKHAESLVVLCRTEKALGLECVK